ncbi:hypothetical protein F4815DRAFT_502497 [Daldinia loculata]|nr:hypothetical protein F4815DRAFT_502497 [Daldinia loculata]
MRKSDLVTALAVILGAAFNGVLATPAPILQQDQDLPTSNHQSTVPSSSSGQLQHLPNVRGAKGSDTEAEVKGGYGSEAVSSEGLVQIPGAPVTAGQLVALPGLEESTAAGETATSSAAVESLATGTTYSTTLGTTTDAGVEISSSAAVLETSKVIVASSSSSSAVLVGSVQSFQVMPTATATSSAAINVGVVANSSTLAVVFSSASIQSFRIISADVSATVTSPIFANVSTSALVVNVPGAVATSRFGGFSNTTVTAATTGAVATNIDLPPGSVPTGLVALPTGGAVTSGSLQSLLASEGTETAGVQQSLSGALGSSSGLGSSVTAIEARPTEATSELRELPSVQTTLGSLVPITSGVTSSTAVAAASGVSTNNTLPSFSLSAAAVPKADAITAMLVVGVTEMLAVLFM